MSIAPARRNATGPVTSRAAIREPMAGSYSLRADGPSGEDNGDGASRVPRARTGRSPGRGGRAPPPTSREEPRPADADSGFSQGQGPASGGDPQARARDRARRG